MQWIASRSLSSGVHSRDPLARNDGETDFPEIGWHRPVRFATLGAMRSHANSSIRPAPLSGIAARVDAIDWTRASNDLDAQGCAVLKGLLSAEECRALAALYPDDSRFRSRVVMGRHGFRT
jgi:hypothetical protein